MGLFTKNYVIKGHSSKNFKKTYKLLLKELPVSDDLELKWKTDDKLFICKGEMWNTFLLSTITDDNFILIFKSFCGKKYSYFVHELLKGLKEDLEWNYDMCFTNTHPKGIDTQTLERDGLTCIHNGEMN